jgi:hypothetical protein
MASASSGGSGSSPTPAPGAVANAPSTYELFYSLPIGQVYTADQLLAVFGINIQTIDIVVLNYQGFYPVVETTPTANPQLYTATPVYTVNGEVADQTWTIAPRPLPTAKANGTAEVQATANQEISLIVYYSGYSAEVLSAAGAALEVDRPATYQTVIAEQQVVSDNLAVQVEAIANATTVDEVNSIVTPPYGIFVSGRGGAGPLDMNPSYFSELNNLPPGIGEAQLEIYIPGTNTVIPYDAGLPSPYYFDSTGNCYTGTDFRTTFRIAATGEVLGTVIPAFGANVPIPWTYNPVIPAASGGSSSSVSE